MTHANDIGIRDKLYQSAIHEAGHLLIAKILNVPFEKRVEAAELPENQHPTTYTVGIVDYDNATLQELFCNIFVLRASYVAEKIGYGEVYQPGMGQDNIEIEECRKAIAGRWKIDYNLNDIDIILQDIMSCNMPILEVFANNLWFNGKISHSDVDEQLMIFPVEENKEKIMAWIAQRAA